MSLKKFEIVQIVRNWGPVGGMEAYVWHISHELALQNCSITIICEKSHAKNTSNNISVIEIGQLRQKPRWLLYWRFAKHVQEIIESLRLNKHLIIHSHERSISHDITTFHSMPFATIKEKSWWKLISIRVWTYLYMERRELGGFKSQPVIVIPVSEVISKAIQKYYPKLKTNLQNAITPGVTTMPTRPFKMIQEHDGTVGFIGKEWKRKGLPLFIKIVKQLKIKRPNLKVLVLGPEKSEVEHLCISDNEIIFRGWQSSADIYQELDLLIHPASSEAYGMVVAEAMSCKVPVVVSDACGAAADVSSDFGSVLSIHSPLEEWVKESERWLRNSSNLPKYNRPWSQVVHEYLFHYQKIFEKNKINN